jgi:hypothetical protein
VICWACSRRRPLAGPDDEFGEGVGIRADVHGITALMGGIVPQHGNPFTAAIASGKSHESSSANLLQPLEGLFEVHREAYVPQWYRIPVRPKYYFRGHTAGGGRTRRLSRCIPIAHEDKSSPCMLEPGPMIPCDRRCVL